MMSGLVAGGVNTIKSATGEVLCHGARQVRRNMNSKARRKAVEAWEDALTLAGLMTGVEACRSGEACRCMVLAVTGEWLPRGHGVDMRDGYVDAGHIVADVLDGAVCGCNLLPVEGEANRNDGDSRPTVSTSWPMATYVEAWRTVALASMTGTKRSRAV